MTDMQKKILGDPQTSIGLLVAIEKNHTDDFIKFAKLFDLDLKPLGQLVEKSESAQLNEPNPTLIQ